MAVTLKEKTPKQARPPQQPRPAAAAEESKLDLVAWFQKHSRLALIALGVVVVVGLGIWFFLTA